MWNARFAVSLVTVVSKAELSEYSCIRNDSSVSIFFLFLRLSEFVKPIKNPARLLFRSNALDGVTLLKLVSVVMF